MGGEFTTNFYSAIRKFSLENETIKNLLTFPMHSNLRAGFIVNLSYVIFSAWKLFCAIGLITAKIKRIHRCGGGEIYKYVARRDIYEHLPLNLCGLTNWLLGNVRKA